MRTLAPREIAIAVHKKDAVLSVSRWMRQETSTSQNVVRSSLALHLTTSVVPDQPSLQLDLPDPESDDISTMEFLARLEQAWAICDRFDLQTEIWRGRILGAVRDREKRGGEGRGAGFLQWLRENEISKTRAYGLIQLAEACLLYTSPSPRDKRQSRMPSSA